MSYLAIILMILTAILTMALPIPALIHLNRHIPECSTRLLWVLIIFLMPIIGSLLYFAIEQPRREELPRPGLYPFKTLFLLL